MKIVSKKIMYVAFSFFLISATPSFLISITPSLLTNTTPSISAGLLTDIPHFLWFLTKKMTIENGLFTNTKEFVHYLTKPNQAQKTTKKEAEKFANDLKKTLEEKKLTHSFLLGASTSDHQCAHVCTEKTCDWARFAKEKNYLTQEISQCNIVKNYESYITQLKEKVGINSLRFSIEWAWVQPKKPQNDTDLLDDNNFNAEALKHYAARFKTLINNDITPVVCFHHYTNPIWFTDNEGFEKKENNKYFVAFCQKIYEKIMREIHNDLNTKNKFEGLTKNSREGLWATFNSPEGYAFKGYHLSDGPPNNPDKKGLKWTMQVLENIMHAHVDVYTALKESYKTNFANQQLPEPKIGLLKNVTQFNVARKSIINIIKSPASWICCRVAENINYDCIYSFFKTGIFKVDLPGIQQTRSFKPKATESLDWIGLNYYSNFFMDLTKKLEETDPSSATDNKNYRIYPYGLYKAIEEINTHIVQNKNIPIYVTENGIATTDTNKRNYFYKEYLSMLKKAIADGYPVSGYLTWTAIDNYEWPNQQQDTKNDRRMYGICSVSEDGKTLTLKTDDSGHNFYADMIKAVAPKPTTTSAQ